MFKNAYQMGLMSIFFSSGAQPLSIWDTTVHFGHIKRVVDEEINSIVLEIRATNVACTYITCPPKDEVLGIRLPFLILILKNLNKYFTFEVTVLDDQNMRRRFRVSNFMSTTKIRPFGTQMPIRLSPGWNQVMFNLADFTRRAYSTTYYEALKVQVHGNIRLRRIYFAERLYTEDELPRDFKLYMPLKSTPKRGSRTLEQKSTVQERTEISPPPPTPGKEESISEPASKQEDRPSLQKERESIQRERESLQKERESIQKQRESLQAERLSQQGSKASTPPKLVAPSAERNVQIEPVASAEKISMQKGSRVQSVSSKTDMEQLRSKEDLKRSSKGSTAAFGDVPGSKRPSITEEPIDGETPPDKEPPADETVVIEILEPAPEGETLPMPADEIYIKEEPVENP